MSRSASSAHGPSARLLPVVAVACCALWSARADAQIQEVLAISGPYDFSIDGAGSNTTNNHKLTLQKPSDTATVFAVYATITTVRHAGDPGVNSLTVAGIPVSLDQVAVTADGAVHTRFDDITAEVGAWFDALTPGAHNVPITETVVSPLAADGAAVFVVWEDAATLPVSTLALVLGLEEASETPSHTITTHPMNDEAPGFAVTAGVGISFSYTGLSTVSFNGAVLTSQAGGFDDGLPGSGGLFTIGGDGDGPDAERYDVTPYVSAGDTELTLAVSGASDDYLFAAWMKVTAAGLAGVDTCGDYAVTGAEECDDGNFVDGDGCSAVCEVEDRDDDGLLDNDEVVHGTDPDVPDTDGDGLLDGEEVHTHGTDPTDADSDDDGLTDGAELLDYATNPNDADSDDDGLTDGAEVNEHGTDPNDADTDDGGVGDGAEIALQRDPLDPSDDDPDGDGLTNGAEDALGTDRNDPDSDDDGLDDGAEVNTHGTNPLDSDSDDDGLTDAAEVGTHLTDPTDADTDDDGLSDGAEIGTHGTDPNDDDSDDDGLTDGAEVNDHGTDPLDDDSDDDGLADGAEVNDHGTNPLSADSDGDGLDDAAELETHGTDPNDADSDDDGLTDAAEVNDHGTDPLSADSDGDGLNDGAEVNDHGTDPLDDDSDDDGLSDGAEVDTHGTDPTNEDTDGAGASDGQEVENGTDPLDPSDDVPPSENDDDDNDDDDNDDGDDAGGVPDTGCGCSSSGGDSASLGALLFALAFLHRRRRAKA